MSLSAAKAMDDLAECLRIEADDLPAGMAKATLFAMARAHESAAARIRDRAQREIGGKPVEVPDEFKAGQAGARKADR